MSALSRRSLVASAAALPALAVPAVAVANAAEPDPVFAAIAAHREGCVNRMRASRLHIKLQGKVEMKAHSLGKSFADVEREHIGECTASHGYCVACAEKEARAAERAANEVQSEADLELVDVVPTTMPGVIALLQYIEEFWEQGIELPEEPKGWHSGPDDPFFEEYRHSDLRDKFNGEPLVLPAAYWIMQNVREALQSLMAVRS